MKTDLGRWEIVKEKMEHVLYHKCSYGHKQKCSKLRNADIWICKECLLVAPDEISFAADLAPCEKNQPVSDEELRALIAEAMSSLMEKTFEELEK